MKKYKFKEKEIKDLLEGTITHVEFKMLRDGRLICEMKSSYLMSPVVRGEFEIMKKALNDAL